MKFTNELCDGCFNAPKAFEEWTGGENFYRTTTEKRKAFWEYASSNLEVECLEVWDGDEGAIKFCLECCKNLIEAWAEHKNIPVWKVLD